MADSKLNADLVLRNVFNEAEGTLNVTAELDTTGLALEAKQDTANTHLDAIKTAVQLIDNAVSGNEFQVDVVSSSLPTGASTEALQTAGNAYLQSIDGFISFMGDSYTSDGSPVPTNVAVVAGTDGTNAQTLKTNSTGQLETVSASGSSATVAAVADSATNVTLLAASTSRLGAMFFNDSTEILYLKLGATATTSSYSVKLAPGDLFELPGPNIYNGIVDGIWAANASGNCLVTSW